MAMFSTVVYGSEGDQRANHATQQHALGTEMHFRDGRKFRYCKNGAVAAVRGNLYQSAVLGADYDELAVPTARAIGATTVTLTLGSTAVTANQFAEGYLSVEDDAGEGYLYEIESNEVAAASGTLTLVLRDPRGLQVAWTTATTVSVQANPFGAVIIHPSPPTTTLVGVAQYDLTASYFGWFQYKGLATVLTEGTLVVGKEAMPSTSTDGAVAPYGAGGGDTDEIHIGQVREVAATTEYSLVMLNLA